MNIQQALMKLDMGNAVAEFDKALERYFVETETFRALVEDKADIIAGDKGAGKTAMYQYLTRCYLELPELADVEIITGFNPSGKRALTRLSEDRVEDTLLAEVSRDVSTLIEGFRDSKVEHNEASIAKLFGVEPAQARAFAKILLDIGFLEQTGDTYKVPILYRDGLNITQGKAF